MIDPPSLPQKPYFPNRMIVSLGSIVFGFIAGAGLAALVEFVNPRLNSEAELRDLVPVPVLVTIPRLESPEEQQASRRRRLIEAVAAGLLLMFVPAATLITYLKA